MRTSRIMMIIAQGAMIVLAACSPKEAFTEIDPIVLDGVKPIGIVPVGDQYWLSDSDKHRLVKIEKSGEIVGEIQNLERPMHIDYADGTIYIPSYGLDVVLNVKGREVVDSFGLELELEAPAGVSVVGDKIAIADFYNHRIVFYNGSEWLFFGGEQGTEAGQFDYPTDVQILGDKIFVADAYNNRGQILDFEGKPQLIFGEELEFNAATGIFVTEELIALTDFENDRLLIFNHAGEVQSTLTGSLHKPTDVLIQEDMVYVTNYAGGYISRFQMN